MNALFSYLLLSSLFLSLFVIFYLLLLRKETFHTENRIYLLISGLLSLLLPLVKIWPDTRYIYQIRYYMKPVLVTKTNASVENNTLNFSLPEIIYFSAAAILLLVLLIKIVRIAYLASTGKRVEAEGHKIIIIEKTGSPFSFFNRIFMTKEQFSSPEINKILAHENTHIMQLHSLDLLFIEIIKIFQWFNPFAWKLKKEIEAQHEFAADSSLISSGIDVLEYKNILISYSLGIESYSVTNNFNSLLKRRFEMLSGKHTNKKGKFKFVFTLPLLIIMLITANIVNSGSAFAQDKNKKDKVFTYVDHMPEYPGGVNAMIEFISTNIKYPEVMKEKGIQGKVYTQFVITETGKIEDLKVAKGVSKELDEEALRVIKMMPDWKPGSQNGKPVSVRISVPIAFALK